MPNDTPLCQEKNTAKSALENSFSSDMKFKMLVRMKEGHGPVPQCRPFAER
jgi:hypothetical protein